jgi:HD domain
MTDASWARAIAHDLLATELPRRWAHTQGVAAKARRMPAAIPDEPGTLEAAAWCHDIGYSLALVDSGFHPLDGARYLRDVVDADGIVCRLVAHHSCATVEADERGLAKDLLAEFPPPPAELLDALTFCDMTTGPDGGSVSIDDRIADILDRYDAHHVVNRSVRQAAPLLIRTTEAIAERWDRGSSQPRWG